MLDQIKAMREGGVPVAICRADAGYLTDGGLNLSDMMGMRLSCQPAERLLDAAFGSVQIVQLSDLLILTESMHNHWKE